MLLKVPLRCVVCGEEAWGTATLEAILDPGPWGCDACGRPSAWPITNEGMYPIPETSPIAKRYWQVLTLRPYLDAAGGIGRC